VPTPRRKPGALSTELVGARLTLDESKALKAYVKRRHTTASALVRSLVLVELGLEDNAPESATVPIIVVDPRRSQP
jgi:hypothetical protein